MFLKKYVLVHSKIFSVAMQYCSVTTCINFALSWDYALPYIFTCTIFAYIINTKPLKACYHCLYD